MKRSFTVVGLVAWLVLALAGHAPAQDRARAPTQSTSSRILTTSGGRIVQPASGRTGPRSGIILPGSPTPPLGRAPRIILPGEGQPSRGPIIRPGAQPDPSRRLILPGDARQIRGPVIVRVNGASVASMARALRSVGEHRLAASLCRQTGGCNETPSPRALNENARRGAVPVQIRLDTDRRIYTANNRTVRNEDAEDETARMPRLERVHGRNDPMAQRAYDKAGVVLAFYRTVLGRRSFDDRNSPVNYVVHYGEDDDNAAWYGATDTNFGQALAVFGDGNDEQHSLIEGEVSYHEFTHGVVDETAELEYAGESGALHEHFADALAETAQQWEQGQSVREAQWLFGENTARVSGSQGALRSFTNPPQYDQPGHTSQVTRHHTGDDHGGVHALAGIPNRAFFGAAQRLGGHSWEHVGVIWYAALRDFLGPRANFRDAAQATVRAATELFGERSREARAVRAGWAEVGIRVTAYRIPPGSIVPASQMTERYGGPRRDERPIDGTAE